MSRARRLLRPARHGAHVLAVILGMSPTLPQSAGSPGFAARIKSVHELIIAGERPEISACLYATELAVDTSREFERVRWSDRISDESVVREYRLGSDWVRATKFEANALTKGVGIFAKQRWVDVLVECQQVNEKAPIVTVRLKLEKASK